jgi:hypothetical protein
LSPLFPYGEDDIDNKLAIISMELTAYWNKSAASFSQQYAWKNLDATPGHLWWQTHGSSTPDLRCVSMGLCSKLIGAGESERKWKEWKQTQTKSQNRMLHVRAEKKLFVHANLELDRQASEFDPVYGKAGGTSDLAILKNRQLEEQQKLTLLPEKDDNRWVLVLLIIHTLTPSLTPSLPRALALSLARARWIGMMLYTNSQGDET